MMTLCRWSTEGWLNLDCFYHWLSYCQRPNLPFYKKWPRCKVSYIIGERRLLAILQWKLKCQTRGRKEILTGNSLSIRKTEMINWPRVANHQYIKHTRDAPYARATSGLQFNVKRRCYRHNKVVVSSVTALNKRWFIGSVDIHAKRGLINAKLTFDNPPTSEPPYISTSSFYFYFYFCFLGASDFISPLFRDRGLLISHYLSIPILSFISTLKMLLLVVKIAWMTEQ